MISVTRLLAVVLVLSLGMSARAEDDDAPVGYGGAYVQLKPLMVPTRDPDGRVSFEVVTVRLILDAGERERVACFSAPIVHEKLLMYLYDAKLTKADLVGQRREVLAKKMLDVAIGATAKGFYSAVQIIDPGGLELQAKKAAGGKSAAAATPAEQLENKSKTLTNQCQ